MSKPSRLRNTLTSAIAAGFIAAPLIHAEPLEENFEAPPTQYRPETWFHIIGYNMGKEGLTKDLEAIKAAGIQGIHLFCRGGGDFPDVKNVIPLSSEWFSLMGHAASECERLGLRLTLQNCGGWAMTGGPWVPVEEAQRELVEAVFHTKDGAFDKDVPLPKDFLKKDKDYKDITVIAFPTPAGDDVPVLIPDSIESNNDAIAWAKLLDPKTRYTKPIKGGGGIPGNMKDRVVGKVKGEDTYVQMSFKEPVTVRSISLPSTASVAGDSKVVSDIDLVIETMENGKLRKVGTVSVPDGNWMDKQYDITLAVPEFTSKEFRITFAGKQEAFLAHLHVSGKPRANNWEAKAAYALRSLQQDVQPKYPETCYIDPKTILDLSDKLSGNKLDWSPPSGDWTVIRYGHVNMGSQNSPSPKELQGWETNKIDKEPLDNHIRNGMVGQLNKPGGALNGKLDGLLADSWERMIPNWTTDSETVFKEFEKRRGYSMRPFMPAMSGYLVGDTSLTDRFYRDLRQTMDDLYVENFFAHFTALSNEQGAQSYIGGVSPK